MLLANLPSAVDDGRLERMLTYTPCTLLVSWWPSQRKGGVDKRGARHESDKPKYVALRPRPRPEA